MVCVLVLRSAITTAIQLIIRSLASPKHVFGLFVRWMDMCVRRWWVGKTDGPSIMMVNMEMSEHYSVLFDFAFIASCGSKKAESRAYAYRSGFD